MPMLVGINLLAVKVCLSEVLGHHYGYSFFNVVGNLLQHLKKQKPNLTLLM